MSRNRVNQLFALFLVALLGGLVPACKKPVPTPPPVEPPKPELTIYSVIPSQGRSDQSTSAILKGAGFEKGARVTVGDSVVNVTSMSGSSEMRIDIPSGMQVGTYDVVVTNPGEEKKEARLRGGFTVTAPPVEQPKPVECTLENVYFDFDMATLSDAAQNTLRRDADCLKAKNAGKVQVEGNTDERGSTDYNLALGQRRADEVKKYLSSLGVSNITTISYGEERPAVDGHDEDAWSKNRRAEIHISE